MTVDLGMDRDRDIEAVPKLLSDRIESFARGGSGWIG